MFASERLILDTKRRTSEGYLRGRARVARTGIYDYAGVEVDPENKHGLRDKAVVKVFRPGDEVFSRDSLASFIGKPITDDHPREAVTADNWRQHARGTIMGAVRDGEYVAFDYLLTDADAIRSVDAGKRELSNGYATDLEFTPGTFNGQTYDAVQRSIRGNHLALCDRGRAGSECAIMDSMPVCDAITAERLEELTAILKDSKETVVKTITLDGIPVKLDDAEQVEAAINKLKQRASDAEQALTDAIAAHDKALATKDAEIDDLKGKVVDQAKIDELADQKATVVADAKKIAGEKLGDTAGKSVADVRRMAVAAKLGDDVVKDKSDEYIEARFDGLKDAGPSTNDSVANLTPASTVVNDNRSVADLARTMAYVR